MSSTSPIAGKSLYDFEFSYWTAIYPHSTVLRIENAECHNINLNPFDNYNKNSVAYKNRPHPLGHMSRMFP